MRLSKQQKRAVELLEQFGELVACGDFRTGGGTLHRVPRGVASVEIDTGFETVFESVLGRTLDCLVKKGVAEVTDSWRTRETCNGKLDCIIFERTYKLIQD